MDNSPLFDALLKTVDRLLISQGTDPEIMTEQDKIFIAIEWIEVDAAKQPTPQEDPHGPVSHPEPV